jgi:hypothetical protein
MENIRTDFKENDMSTPMNQAPDAMTRSGYPGVTGLIRTFLLAAALALAAPVAQATLVTNGGFETYTGTPPPGLFGAVRPDPWLCAGTYCNNAAVKIFAPGTASLNLDGGMHAYPGFPNQSPALGNFLAADPCYGQNPGPCSTTTFPGTSTIYQPLGVLSPGDYVLTFWQAEGQWAGFTGNTTGQWEVGLGNMCLNPVGCPGTFVGDIDFSPLMVNNLPPGGFVPWNQVTLTLTVPTTSAGVPQFLSFMALGNPSVPPMVYLDGISLNPLPEPSSLSILGFGLLGLIILGLRRQARAA